MHDDVATAQDRHRQSNIDKSTFQGELSDGTHASGVLVPALLDRSSRTGLLLRQVILSAIISLTKHGASNHRMLLSTWRLSSHDLPDSQDVKLIQNPDGILLHPD